MTSTWSGSTATASAWSWAIGTKDIAVKARTAAMISLKQVIVNAPPSCAKSCSP